MGDGDGRVLIYSSAMGRDALKDEQMEGLPETVKAVMRRQCLTNLPRTTGAKGTVQVAASVSESLRFGDIPNRNESWHPLASV